MRSRAREPALRPSPRPRSCPPRDAAPAVAPPRCGRWRARRRACSPGQEPRPPSPWGRSPADSRVCPRSCPGSLPRHRAGRRPGPRHRVRWPAQGDGLCALGFGLGEQIRVMGPELVVRGLGRAGSRRGRERQRRVSAPARQVRRQGPRTARHAIFGRVRWCVPASAFSVERTSPDDRTDFCRFLQAGCVFQSPERRKRPVGGDRHWHVRAQSRWPARGRGRRYADPGVLTECHIGVAGGWPACRRSARPGRDRPAFRWCGGCPPSPLPRPAAAVINTTGRLREFEDIYDYGRRNDGFLR